MRISAAGLAGIAFLAGASPGLGADPLAECNQLRDATLRIKACTEIVKSRDFSAEQKAVAFRNRGLARADAGAAPEAIDDFNEALRLNPKDASGLAARAQMRITRGDIDGALADYDGALLIAPSAVPYFIGRGHARLVKGMADLAIADFTEAIRLNPKSASAFNNRGLAWRKQNDLDKAIADYTEAITINPIYALAYNNRGYAYEAKGARQEAAADYGRALVLDRSLIEASKGLQRLGAKDPLAGEAKALITQGKAIVEASCSRCHAVGAAGASPNPKAPEFRRLQTRHPVQALREPMSRGIAATHEEMPKFALKELEVDAIVAYMNSLPNTGKR